MTSTSHFLLRLIPPRSAGPTISHAWSWAVIEAVDTGFVYFRQVSAQEAARRGPLVTPLPRSA